MNINSKIRTLLWVIAILAMTHASHAQTISGRWHKVALPQPVRAGNDNTQDFNFIDSLNGICISDFGLVSSTTDGGRTWVLDTNLGNDYIDRKDLNSVECTAPHHGFYHGGNYTISIAPSKTNILFPPEAGQINYGDYTTLAEKMYDTAYGFRLAEIFSSVVMIVTHDGWQSSVPYDSGYLQNVQSPISAYIVDSNDVWAEEGEVETRTGFVDSPKVILHSTNGGITWQSFDAFDSARYRPWVQELLVNPKTHEVFCTVYNSDIDYAYSSDYGITWQLDSSFKGSKDEITWHPGSKVDGVLWRMANPAPGILWAMIGGSGYSNVEIVPTRDAIGGDSNYYSRKLAYSSDNGATWAIDSTTFINDSLEEMHWLNARHGWIASWSHDSLFMWYYDADGTSGVVEHYLHSPAYSLLYPDPVTSTLYVDAPGLKGQVLVFDVLGRVVISTVLPSSDKMQIDVRALPRGPYMVVIGNLTSQFLKD
ncbi:MAG TPA: T9SS type A sorting domain-containing protein [Candidatus Kapabacteria bacterium]|nr:T9SS type A sorting domain-containing protein [Candidatus Kapabacteria bacterium]